VDWLETARRQTAYYALVANADFDFATQKDKSNGIWSYTHPKRAVPTVTVPAVLVMMARVTRDRRLMNTKKKPTKMMLILKIVPNGCSAKSAKTSSLRLISKHLTR